MRSFLLPSRGDANAPARSVEQPAASQVPSSADQPSLQDMSTHNVTLPAHETSFNTLKDLRQWLHHLSEPDQSSAPVCWARHALCVLELQSSRDTRKQIQALLKDWDITQYQNASRKKTKPASCAAAIVFSSACGGQQITSVSTISRLAH